MPKVLQYNKMLSMGRGGRQSKLKETITCLPKKCWQSVLVTTLDWADTLTMRKTSSDISCLRRTRVNRSPQRSRDIAEYGWYVVWSPWTQGVV